MTTLPVLTDEPWVEVDGRRWPVVEDIPYLRAGREDLATAALDALLAGDDRLATAILLTDRDDWAPGPPPTVAGTLAVLDAVDAGCTLRHAMLGLGFGPVADYFAHRWSDPTYLSGLALVETAWPDGDAPHVVELACGIGQLLAAAAAAGARVTGFDVVFAKLWLARRFVVPDAALWCLDVERSPLPVPDGAADLAVVHDALYFLDDKVAVVGEARRVGAAVAIGHAHNALVDNHSAGRPLDPAAWSALLPGAECFDDLELTASWLGGRSPRPQLPEELGRAAAIALVSADRRTVPPRPVGWPAPGRRLRLNPLLELGPGDPGRLTVRWPSARYRDEYAPISAYLARPSVPYAALARAEAGIIDDPVVAELIRHRIVLDLPERW